MNEKNYEQIINLINENLLKLESEDTNLNDSIKIYSETQKLISEAEKVLNEADGYVKKIIESKNEFYIYLKWKKGLIKKIINKEYENINYSVEKNLEDLKYILPNSSIDELNAFEKYCETYEKEIYIKYENEMYVLENYLLNILLPKIKDEVNEMEPQLKQYLIDNKEDDDYEDINIYKGIILEKLYKERTENIEERFINIYELNHIDLEKINFDKENKLISLKGEII